MFNMHFIIIPVVVFLSAMSPGPDFAIVVKNCLGNRFSVGVFTAFGIATAAMIHVSYCVFGLAVAIEHSKVIELILFIVGAAYLAYLGVGALRSRGVGSGFGGKAVSIKPYRAFASGFWCHLLNPKAISFFVAFFTPLVGPHLSRWQGAIYAAEVFIVLALWFSLLSFLICLPKVRSKLMVIQAWLVKLLGVILLGFAVTMVIEAIHLVG